MAKCIEVDEKSFKIVFQHSNASVCKSEINEILKSRIATVESYSVEDDIMELNAQITGELYHQVYFSFHRFLVTPTASSDIMPCEHYCYCINNGSSYFIKFTQHTTGKSNSGISA